jgi:hypothetical protein
LTSNWAEGSLTEGTNKLKVDMLKDSKEQWRLMDEIEEYIFVDIEDAWLFQNGAGVLRLTMFPRRVLYYAMLLADVPSPEVPARTARRRLRKLEICLKAIAQSCEVQGLEAQNLRDRLQHMKKVARMSKTQAHAHPGTTRKAHDNAAALSVIQDLFDNEIEKSELAGDQFLKAPDLLATVRGKNQEPKAAVVFKQCRVRRNVVVHIQERCRGTRRPGLAGGECRCGPPAAAPAP